MKAKIVFLLLLACSSLGTTSLAAAETSQPKTASVERSGSWFDPARSGEGFVIQFLDERQAVIYWFTFDESGGQRWFTGLGTASGNTLQIDELLITDGGVFGAGFDPDEIERIPVGELSIVFSGQGDNEAARADYTIDGVSGRQNLRRLTRPIEVAGITAPLVPRKSGSWFDATRSGEGFAMEILPDGRPVAYWFTYDRAGNQAWMIGVGETSVGLGSVQIDMLQPIGGRFGPDFDPDDVDRTPVGTTRLSLQCNGGYGDYVTTDPADFTDLRFDLEQLVGVGANRCEDPALVNLFPLVDGAVDLPDHAAGRQYRWFLELASGAAAGKGTISDAELRERFTEDYLDAFGIDALRDFLDDYRMQYVGARLTDPSAVTPAQIVGLITADDGREAFTVLQVDLAEEKINFIQVSFFGFGAGTIVSANDQVLDLEGAADRFASLTSQPGLLVARIDEDNQCQPLVERNADTPRSIASIFKLYILGGVARAIEAGALFHDQIVPLDASKQVAGGLLANLPGGLEFTVDSLSTLMLGISDNTATDMLLGLAGRDRFEGLHAEYGHSRPNLMSPQLGISEQFHLFFSFSEFDARSYVNGSEAFQRSFLENRIVPLGSASTGGGGFFNESLFIEGAWRASPMDICGAFARHRQHPPGSDEALLVERALQAGAAQPNVREHWDRVWYKGGSLESGVNGLLVLTHAWMLEREGEQPIVVAGFSNDLAGGIDGFVIQSILGRILELARDL